VPVTGSDPFSQCTTLKTCQKALPTDPTSVLTFLRCSDGKTCTVNYENCPTTKSCMEGVMCPDGSCKKSAFECVEPPPHIAYDKISSCGKNMLKCANGLCSSNCTNQIIPNCLSSNQAYCGATNKCAANYRVCDEPTYCMLFSNYTFAPDTFMCGNGPHYCVTDTSQCKTTGLTTKLG
jgi:hypothetical protein